MRKEVISLFFIFISTVIGNIFAEFYPIYPQWLKTIYGICIYISLLALPLNLLKFNYELLYKYGKILYFLILSLGFVVIMRGTFSDNLLKGNKYITLFFNPIFAPVFFLPIFILYNSKIIIRNLFNYVLINVSIISIMVWLHSIDLKIILIVCVIFPMVNWKQRIILFSFILICIYCNFPGVRLLGGGSRKLLIVIIFASLSYILAYILKNKKLILSFAVVVSILPIVAVYSSLGSKKESIFNQLEEILLSNKSSSGLKSNDTRTFLYRELALDLTRNDAWVWGKGAYSWYYSAYFDQSSVVDGDSAVRGGIEVTALHYLLRAGTMYLLIFIAFIQISIYLSLFFSRNKWLIYIALNLNGFYLNLFLGDFNGFDFTSVCIWIFIGLSLNKKWLFLDDIGLKRLVNKAYYER